MIAAEVSLLSHATCVSVCAARSGSVPSCDCLLRWSTGKMSHRWSSAMAPAFAIAHCVAMPLDASRPRAEAACLLAPVVPDERSATSGAIPPAVTMSAQLLRSRASTASVAAACSWAACDTSPRTRHSMNMWIPPLSTMVRREIGSVTSESDQSAYSCASTMPSCSPSWSSATKGATPPAMATARCESSPPSDDIWRTATPARCRTSSESSARSLTSCCVTCTRSSADLSAILESAAAAFRWPIPVDVLSCFTSCGMAPARARAPRLSASSESFLQRSHACSCASTL